MSRVYRRAVLTKLSHAAHGGLALRFLCVPFSFLPRVAVCVVCVRRSSSHCSAPLFVCRFCDRGERREQCRAEQRSPRRRDTAPTMASVHSPLMPNGNTNSSSSSSSNGASSSPRSKSKGAAVAASDAQVTVDVRAELLSAALAPSDDDSEQLQKSPKGAASSSPSASSMVDDDAHQEEFLRIVRMTGYQFSWALELRYWCACVFSAFVVWLLALWFPDSMVPWRYKEVSLDDAELVQVVGKVHGSELIKVQELGQDVMEAMAAEERREEEMERSQGAGHSNRSQKTAAQKRRGSMDLLHQPQRKGKMIVFRHMRFIYSPSARTFIMQQADVIGKRSEGQSIDQRHTSVAALKAKELNERLRVGLTHDQVLDNRVLYGENALVLEVPSIPRLLFTEVFHPFYVFQVGTRPEAANTKRTACACAPLLTCSHMCCCVVASCCLSCRLDVLCNSVVLRTILDLRWCDRRDSHRVDRADARGDPTSHDRVGCPRSIRLSGASAAQQRAGHNLIHQARAGRRGPRQHGSAAL